VASFFNKKNRKTNFMMMNWKKNFLKPGKKTSYNVCFFPNCSKLLLKIITIGNSQIRVRCKHNHIILNLDWELEEKMCSKTTWKGVTFFNDAVQILKGIFFKFNLERHEAHHHFQTKSTNYPSTHTHHLRNLILVWKKNQLRRQDFASFEAIY